jgi:hypothetical protein
MMTIVPKSRRWKLSVGRALTAVAAVVVLAPVVASAQQNTDAWKPAPAPLTTRWAKEVSPANVRPEYPRPQLVRSEWKSLNGLWQFAFDDKNEGRAQNWHTGKTLPQRILVPFTFEAALSGIGKGKEVHERVWYRRTFDIPAAWRGRRVRLNVGASDWETTVWVNGKLLGTHRGGYTPFSFDITDALEPGDGPAAQEVVVAVYDPADPRDGAFQPKGKQLGSEGIWYTRTTGIWQSVWLEPVSATHLRTVRATGETPDDRRAYWLRVEGRVPPKSGERPGAAASAANRVVITTGITAGPRPVRVDAEVVTPDGATRLRASSGRVTPGTSLTFAVPAPSPRLWSPESPNLYDVTLTLRDDRTGTTLDTVKTYTAFRTVGIKNGRLTLNGKPYFYRGVLDQGYWPDGILTPPTDAALRHDVAMTKKLGFNMARKHVKVEDPRWYYYCDKLGLAVWQDMPSAHAPLHSDPAAQANFTREWRAVMEATRVYPSVVHWIPFNENWGDPQAFQDRIVRVTRQTDPTRPITDASGWTQRGETDVIDVHDYGNNLRRQGIARPVKPKVIGEYGGIALPVEGHTWTTGWGYQSARDPAGLLRRVKYQTTQLFEAENLSGFVYTQLTDVEQELNGLLTYDRVPKVAPERAGAVFTGRDRYDAAGLERDFGGHVRDWLVLGPVRAGTDLRTATDNPESRVVLESVLNRSFLADEAGLAPQENAAVTVGDRQLTWKRVRSTDEALDFHKVFGGQTDNAVAYAAAVIDSPQEVRNVTLLLGSDDAAKVWLNGSPVWTVSRVRGVNLDEDEVRGLTLKAGRNVLLIKVAQGIGGWGVGARLLKPNGDVLKITDR